MAAVDDFIAAVEHATGRQGKRVGKNIRLLCPAHDDHDPSLDVAEGDQGQPLIQCRSHGCTYEQVCAAIGHEPADFAPREPLEWTPHGPAVAVYDYTDEQGRLLYQVCRTADKKFPQRRPDPTAKGGWRWSLGDTRRVLYRLQRVLKAGAEAATVYIVEGEKDVLALERAGVVATCNPGGAGKWRPEYSQQLKGATVVIIADADTPGIEHARTVAASLSTTLNGHAPSVRIVTAASGKDASDHLAAGHTLDELVDLDPAPLQLIRVVSLDEFVSVTEDVAPPLIGEPDESLLPSNGLLLMYGDGGAGKTTLSVDALAHLASGKTWLNIPVPRPVRTLLIENEGPRGPFRRRLAAKLDAWQGDPFATNTAVLEEPWTRFTLSDPNYRLALAQQIDEIDTDLVIVGPLASLGARGTGTPDDVNEFSDLVNDLRSSATREFALWIVHHENKAGDVSGAWERWPDTLVHVTAQGNGRTKVHWRKVRWSSTLHNTSVNLLWTEGSGFDIEENVARDYRAELVQAFEEKNVWRTAKQSAGLIGANNDHVKNALGALVEDGKFEFMIGPPGMQHNARGYRLSASPAPAGQHGSATLFGGGDDAADLPTPPISGVKRQVSKHGTHDADPPPPDQDGTAAAYDPGDDL